MHTHKLRAAFGCVLALACLACQGPGILTSLDDLTAHVDSDGFLDLKQQRILSLAGLIPDAPPGSVYRYHGKRSPFTAIGVSLTDGKQTDNSKTGPTKSYVIQRSIPYTGQLDELLELRNNLLHVRQLGARLIRLRLERLTHSKVNSEPEQTSKRLTPAERVSRLSKSKAKATEDTPDLDKQIEQAEKAFTDALTTSQEGLQKEGIMILRAETKRKGSFGSRLGSTFAAGDKSEEKAGFAILAGLRTTRLFVGEDLVEDFKKVATDWYLIGRKFPYILGACWVDFGFFELPILYPGQLGKNDFYLTTSRLEAQYVVYAQDSLEEIRAEVKASFKSLKKLSAIIPVEQAELDFVLNSVANLGSAGILGNYTQREKSLDEYRAELVRSFSGKEGPPKSPDPAPTQQQDWDQDESNPGEKPWTTVYAVMSELDDLETLLRRRPRLHLTSWF